MLPAEGNNREAEEKHTLMLSAEGNSGAGVGRRHRVPARVYDFGAVFDIFLYYLCGQIFPNQFFALCYVKLQWLLPLACLSMRFR